MEQEDYTVQLQGDNRNYDQSMAGSVQQTDALTASLGRLSAGLASLYQRADRKLTIISASEAATITGVTLAAARLEQQMSQLQARQSMLNQTSGTYLKTVNDTRRAWGLQAQDAINLVQQLNQLQVPLTQQQQTINQYVRLSATTGEQINGLAQANTMFMRQMDAAPRTVDRYASMIGQLNAQLGVSAQGTLDFSNQIAPLSRTLGMSAQQIAGVSAAFSKSGQDGYAAANVYTKILSDVNEAIQYGSPEIQTYSDLLGKTVDQFKAMPKAEVITEIFERLNQQGPQAIKTLERLGLEGVRSQRAIQAVVQQGGLRQAIDVAQGGYSNTAGFTNASQKALDGLNDTMSKIGETFKTFGQAVGSTFLPAADLMARGVNTMLSPLRLLSDLMQSAPTWAKALGTVAASGLVLLPLLPKLAMGLAATSIIPQLLRGPLAQGAMLGMNPERRLTAPMRTYVEGGGTAGRRALFAAGMRSGAFISGNTRNLEGLNLVDPDTGQPVDARTWSERMGGLRTGVSSWASAHLGEEGRADLFRRMSSLSLRGGLRSMATTGIRGLGYLARASLNPWAPSYLANSMHGTPDDITQDPTFRRHFTQEGLDENVRQIKEHSKAVATARMQFTDASNGMVNAFRHNTSVLGTIGSELGKTAAATIRGGAGVAVGGGMLAARGARFIGGRALGSLSNFMGGPWGIGLALGTAGYGLYDRNRNDFMGTVKGDGQDNSAGAAYRDALGIASKATTTFAQVVADNASKMQSSAQTMDEAIQVSSGDIRRASGATDYADKNIGNMSFDQAKTYAAAIIPGAQPGEVELLKGDLIRRFGSSQASQILNYGSNQANAGQGTFGLISESGQKMFGMNWLQNGLWATQQTKDSAGMVRDTMKNQLNLVYGREGAEGASRYQQSQVNSFLDQVFTQGQGMSADARGDNFELRLAKGASQVTRQQYAALAGLLGLDPNDTASMDAMDKVLADVAKLPASASAQDRQKAYQDSLSRNLANTDIGSKLAQARNMGGIYSGTSYLVTQPQAKPLDVLGSQVLNAIRGPNAYDQYGLFRGITGGVSIAGQVATQYGYRGAASTVSTALNNEGNADLQALAVRDLITKTNAGQMGDWNQTVSALMNLKDNAGAASSQLSQLADAAMQAAQQERTYQQGMAGHTTFVDTARTAFSDFSAAQAEYRRNPNAPGAYQRVEDTRNTTEQALTAGKDRMQQVAMQYRQFDIQRRQSEEQMARQMSYATQDYLRQRMYGEEDYQRSRSRAEESFARQQSRAVADYNLQRQRSLDDFNLQRTRQEQDYNHQVVLMAEQTAKSVYDTYQRVTVQRTWSGGNLLTNLNDQNSRLSQQSADLARARRMGLSNEAISELGLNESQNAQQLARLVQDMMENPRLVKQYNDSIKRRLSGSTALMKDAANTQWTEMQRAQKLAMDRSEADFNRMMDRQEADTMKAFGRSRQDFGIQMDQAQQDFNTQEDRQREAMNIQFDRQRKDFAYQMKINAENISTFAQDIGMSFQTAFDIVNANVSGETKTQFENLKKLYDSYTKSVTDKNLGLYKAINDPYKQLGLYAPFSSAADKKRLNQGVLPGHMGGGIPIGGPETTSDVFHASGLGGPMDSGIPSTKAQFEADVRDDPLHGALHINTPYGVRGPWASGYHTGVDLRGTEGTPIYAAERGKVIYTGWGGAYGNLTKIDHGFGLQTWYAHQSAQNVHRGDNVYAGEKIGNIGHTGHVIPAGPGGAHLHFELRVNGQTRDPMPWLHGAANPIGGNTPGGTDSGSGISLPDFWNMGAVKKWNANLNRLGIFARPKGITADTLGNMAAIGWDEAVKKKFPGGMPGGTPGGSSSLPGNLGAGLSGTNQQIGHQMMLQAGFPEADWPSLKALWTGESGWNEHALNASSGAYGIPQSLPGSKMASAGADWRNNPRTQIRWGLGYIKSAYGDPIKTYATWLSRHPHWYNGGTSSAAPGWALVGENGPELLHLRGGERIRNSEQTRQAIQASKAQQVVHTNSNTTNNHWDQSMNFTGSITVVSDDPNAMARKLAEKQRLAALTGRR